MTRLPHPLVSAARLRRALEAGEDITLLDVRWQLGSPSGRPEYDAEHLPGAAWVEFEQALSDEPGEGGRHPMPQAPAFQEAMRAVGVRNDAPVVVYDAGNSLAAARCWWLLRYFGHDIVQVLDGGLAAWKAAGGTTSDEVVTPEPGDFVVTPGSMPLLNAEDALELADEFVLVDARPADRFSGQNETVDAVAGHIPGAINLPALSNVSADGCFLPTDDLALRFSARGLAGHERVGVYCGSGVQAMHLALALDVSGLQTETAVYVGSWSEYITDPDRPIETGAGETARS